MDLKELMKNGWSYKRCVAGGGGSADIDVTAQVGQTIVVKEVDANGKPTAWESADYQPRTHWEERRVFASENTYELTLDEESGVFVSEDEIVGAPGLFVDGKLYEVTWNGAKYVCSPYIAESNILSSLIGNISLMTNGSDSGIPFVIEIDFDKEYNVYNYHIISLDGSSSVTLSITELNVTKIPDRFLPQKNELYNITMIYGDGGIHTIDTVQQLNDAINSGMKLCASLMFEGTTYYLTCTGTMPAEYGVDIYLSTNAMLTPDGTAYVICVNIKALEDGTLETNMTHVPLN